MDNQPTKKDIQFVTKLITGAFAGLFVLAIAFCFLAFKETKQSYEQSYPRIRVSKSAPLTLSTTWQRVDFNGTSGVNINTFPTDANGNQLVSWDATNKLFKFANMVDVNYFGYFTGGASSTLLTTPATLRYRFVIPNGNGAGNNYYFPNPDGAQYGSLGPVSYISNDPFDKVSPLYINQMIRTNGLGVEVALSNGTLGTVTLDYSAFLITAGAPTN